MSGHQATLYFMCGKMAAGKSTLSQQLAREKSAVLLVQDALLEALYPGEIKTIPDFVKYSARLRNAISPTVWQLLAHGVSVVLDFPANTRIQRQWFRELFEGAEVGHELHFIDVPDELCKQQLKQRSAKLPAGSAWTTDAEFDAITAYFQAPETDEQFNVVVHARS